MVASAEELINFWFDEQTQPLWFNSTPEFDELLRQRFADTYQKAVKGELSDWNTTPQGALALVILFDQIPLNIFRGQPQSFATEAASRDVAKQAIDQQFDQALSKQQKAFLYMPFMHSENLKDQDISIELFTTAGLTENIKFAKHHRDIVLRFGRFPHRNKILGRENTPEELAYLDSKEAFLG